MKKKIFLIHSINQFMEKIYDPFARQLLEKHNDLDILNICDDSLLKDTLEAGFLTTDVSNRILNYIFCAEKGGADLIMITCTSLNEIAKIARKFTSIPIYSIDEPTVKLASKSSNKIGILATLPTSPKSIIRSITEECKEVKRKIITKVVEGAFQELMNGNHNKHDDMVINSINQLSKEVDTIIFAQVTMSRVETSSCKIPIYKIGKPAFDEAEKILFT